MHIFPAAPSEARLLTDRLRVSVARGPRLERQQQISERDGNLQMVIEGAVVRQRILANGRCQAIAVYFRDEITNLSRFIRKHETRDTLVALRGTVMGSVAPEVVEELRQMSRSGIDGMAALVLRELSISQEHLACVGQRSAAESMAHFLCESFIRAAVFAGEPPKSCALAITQGMLGEFLGISTVHVNRTLQAIRARGLADLQNGELFMWDFDGLAELGEFDDAYLKPV